MAILQRYMRLSCRVASSERTRSVAVRGRAPLNRGPSKRRGLAIGRPCWRGDACGLALLFLALVVRTIHYQRSWLDPVKEVPHDY